MLDYITPILIIYTVCSWRSNDSKDAQHVKPLAQQAVTCDNSSSQKELH